MNTILENAYYTILSYTLTDTNKKISDLLKPLLDTGYQKNTDLSFDIPSVTISLSAKDYEVLEDAIYYLYTLYALHKEVGCFEDYELWTVNYVETVFENNFIENCDLSLYFDEDTKSIVAYNNHDIYAMLEGARETLAAYKLENYNTWYFDDSYAEYCGTEYDEYGHCETYTGTEADADIYKALQKIDFDEIEDVEDLLQAVKDLIVYEYESELAYTFDVERREHFEFTIAAVEEAKREFTDNAVFKKAVEQYNLH